MKKNKYLLRQKSYILNIGIQEFSRKDCMNIFKNKQI